MRFIIVDARNVLCSSTYLLKTAFAYVYGNPQPFVTFVCRFSNPSPPSILSSSSSPFFFISAPGSKSNISQPTIKHIPNHHVVPSKPDIERSKVFIPSSFNCADKKSLRRWRHKKTREKDLCWGSVWCCMFIKQPEKPPSPLERNYENFNKWTLEYCRKFCFHQTKENCEQKKTLSVGEKSWERRAKKKLQNNIYKARSMSRDVMWTICVMRFLSSVDG